MQIRLLVPDYPKYPQLAKFLSFIDGVQQRVFYDMLNKIISETGTPQAPRNWTKPDEWIDEILVGQPQVIASRLWHEFGLNPRHIETEYYFSIKHKLVEENHEGIYRLTEAGKAFITPKNQAEIADELDYTEGLYTLLNIVATKESFKTAEMLGAYAPFVRDHSNFQSESVVSSVHYVRRANLLDRGLIAKQGNSYSITESGLQHIQRLAKKFQGDSDAQQSEITEIVSVKKAIIHHNNDIKKRLKEALSKMNPYKFERLIGQLFQEMGYEDVEVTKASNDKGVDVIATLEAGVSKIREIIQVKRYNDITIGTPEISQLRGRLSDFNAVRGTIISTGKFSKDAVALAYQSQNASTTPITLIDGEKLIALLTKYQIGIIAEPEMIYRFDSSPFEIVD